MSFSPELFEKVLLPQFKASVKRFEGLTAYNQGATLAPLPAFRRQNDSDDNKALAMLSRLDFATLVVRSAAQALQVTGITTVTGDNDEVAWSWWQDSGMQKMEASLYEYCLRYGEAYIHSKVKNGNKVAIPINATRAQGFYEDVSDTYPKYSIVVNKKMDDKHVLWDDPENTYDEFSVFDDTYEYVIQKYMKDDHFTYLDPIPHGFPDNPVVRYYAYIDIDGYTSGDIEKNIDLLRTINSRAFNANLNLHYQSFIIRTATGISLPQPIKDPDTGEIIASPAELVKAMLGHDSWLFDQNPNAKFGSLPAASFDNFKQAMQEAVTHLATLTMTTPGLLLGEISNTKAQVANVVSYANRMKLKKLKYNFSVSHKAVARLNVPIADDGDDDDILFTWASTENSSEAAMTDAIGKQAQMLQAPVTELWRELPDMTPLKYQQWIDTYEKQQAALTGLSNAINNYSANSSGLPTPGSGGSIGSSPGGSNPQSSTIDDTSTGV